MGACMHGMAGPHLVVAHKDADYRTKRLNDFPYISPIVGERFRTKFRRGGLKQPSFRNARGRFDDENGSGERCSVLRARVDLILEDLLTGVR